MNRLQVTNRPAFRTVNGVFDHLFSDLEKQIINRHDSSISNYIAPANVLETADAFHLELMAPGRDKERFQLKVEDSVLTISYEQPVTNEENDVKKVRHEFTLASFQRRFNLDEQVASETIQAKYENGILKVILPKKAEVKPTVHQIAIQ